MIYRRFRAAQQSVLVRLGLLLASLHASGRHYDTRIMRLSASRLHFVRSPPATGCDPKIELTSRFRRFCLCLILHCQRLSPFLIGQWLCSFRSFETAPLYRISSMICRLLPEHGIWSTPLCRAWLRASFSGLHTGVWGMIYDLITSELWCKSSAAVR